MQPFWWHDNLHGIKKPALSGRVFKGSNPDQCLERAKNNGGDEPERSKERNKVKPDGQAHSDKLLSLITCSSYPNGSQEQAAFVIAL
jgi:hypothetical protein